MKPKARIPYTRPRLNPVPFSDRRSVRPSAEAAADRMEAQGGSPRVQLTAAKVASGQRNLTYKPHQGAREKARRAARELVNSGAFDFVADLKLTDKEMANV